MRRLLAGLALLGVVAAGGAAATWWGAGPGWLFERLSMSGSEESTLESLAVYGSVPDFALVERSGRRITRVDLLGTVWVVNFVYTECTETCPLQTANMARLQADFTSAPDLRLVSISVDPDHDTPEILRAYAERFGADPERWLFLTGPREAIYRLAIDGFRLGVTDLGRTAGTARGARATWLAPASAWAHPVPNADRQPIIHSSRFVLVDRRARIRSYHQGTDWDSLERLRANATRVLRERSE
ncbi:MAG: SCO family protein [Candidatus Rokubacteria bacterium]|nr:SCO family protein [Candidatus Rokubacteria bacterium]